MRSGVKIGISDLARATPCQRRGHRGRGDARRHAWASRRPPRPRRRSPSPDDARHGRCPGQRLGRAERARQHGGSSPRGRGRSGSGARSRSRGRAIDDYVATARLRTPSATPETTTLRRGRFARRADGTTIACGSSMFLTTSLPRWARPRDACPGLHAYGPRRATTSGCSRDSRITRRASSPRSTGAPRGAASCARTGTGVQVVRTWILPAANRGPDPALVELPLVRAVRVDRRLPAPRRDRTSSSRPRRSCSARLPGRSSRAASACRS